MGRYGAQIANLLVGNEIDEAVIEMHFPAAEILFTSPALIAITGAEVVATINGERIKTHHPVLVNKNAVLQFRRFEKGARVYLAVKEKFAVDKWLDSYSTNLKAAMGGFHGRALQKNDEIFSRDFADYTFPENKDFVVLPWQGDDLSWLTHKTIKVIAGNEWDWLNENSKERFQNESFSISSSADRMGYRMNGKLESLRNEELVSSAVGFGTIQLLPTGELFVLMADHQTTGGYPRIANVITADLPKLAQSKPGDEISFEMVDIATAEKLLVEQTRHLHQLQMACKFRLEEFF
jgi:antagonist of KipI